MKLSLKLPNIDEVFNTSDSADILEGVVSVLCRFIDLPFNFDLQDLSQPFGVDDLFDVVDDLLQCLTLTAKGFDFDAEYDYTHIDIVKESEFLKKSFADIKSNVISTLSNNMIDGYSLDIVNSEDLLDIFVELLIYNMAGMAKASSHTLLVECNYSETVLISVLDSETKKVYDDFVDDYKKSNGSYTFEDAKSYLLDYLWYNADVDWYEIYQKVVG